MGNGVKSTLTTAATPAGALAQAIRKKLREIQNPDSRTKVIEAAGLPITSGLFKSDPNAHQGCPYLDKCVASAKTDCTRNYSTYRLDCGLCHPDEGQVHNINPVNRSIYVGTTGRSLHSRLDDHMDDIKGGLAKNAMVKHLQAIHPEYPWRTEIPVRARTMKYLTKTLTRTIDECLRLEHNTGLANSKGEWGRGGGMVRSHNTRTNNPGGS